MKRVISLLLAVVMICTMLPNIPLHVHAEEVASGTCGDNLTWAFEDGVLTISGAGPMYDYSDSNDEHAPWYYYSIHTVLIEEGVTSIGEYAFLYSDVESVSIPNSVTSIGKRAFSSCSNLTSITIPDSVTAIADGTFEDCTKLVSITIPNSVVSIGRYAFDNCSNLTSIKLPDSVTSIDYGAFSYCDKLQSIILPNSITSIDSFAFGGCTRIWHVFYTGTDAQWSNISIGRDNNYLTSATRHCNATGEVLQATECSTCTEETQLCMQCSICEAVDNTLTWDGHKYVGGYCDYCGRLDDTCGERLTWALVDGTLTISGTGAMDNYNYHSMPWYSKRDQIHTVVIEEGVTSIGNHAFYSCENVESITIPEGVTNIGDYALESCSSLAYIILPSSIRSIGTAVVEYCENFWHVFYTGTEAQWNNISIDSSNFHLNATPRHYNATGNELVDNTVVSCKGETLQCTQCNVCGANDQNMDSNGHKYEENICVYCGTTYHKCGDDLTWSIADGVLTISGTGEMYNYANGYGGDIRRPWQYVGGYSKLVIDSGVTKIGGWAFYMDNNIESVEIADTVTEIDYLAFSLAINMVSISIPESVTKIGTSAFDSYPYYNNLWHVLYSGTEEQWNAISIDSDNDYLLNVTRHYNAEKNEVQVMDRTACTGETLRTAQCSICGINNQGLDASGHKITNNSCEYCGCHSNICGDNLTWSLADGVLTISGTGAMYDYAHVSDTPWSSISVREQTQTVVIEDGVTSIGNHAFTGFFFESVSIPDTVTSIGEAAFLNCSKLKSVYLPNSITSIGSFAFYECNRLETINIPTGVTVINDHLFGSFNSLKQITIPDSIRTIGENAFNYSWQLWHVLYTGTEAQWNDIDIDAGNTYLINATLHCNATGDELCIIDRTTCTGVTLQYIQCNICNIDNSGLATTGHAEVIDASVDPTCTTTGLTEGKHCSACGEISLAQEVIPALDHKWVPADCTNPKTCDRCGETEGKSLGHAEVIDQAVNATCTTTGLTEGKHCSVCEEILVAQEIIPVLDHTEVIDSAVAASCTTAGLTEGKHCSVCGAIVVLQKVIPATGHDYLSHVCAVCGNIDMESVQDNIAQSEGTPEEIREAVQSVPVESMKQAMEADVNNSEVVAELAELENAIGGGAEIVVVEGCEAFNKNQISIVGANLNAPTGNENIKLIVDVPKEENTIPAGVNSIIAVPFSMDLENAENSAHLDVPVKITLPVPDNMNPNKLVIVHYHADETEILTPTIHAEGGKLYASIVLDKFSDFAISELWDKPCNNGHSWIEATCTSEKICSVCGETNGNSLGHKEVIDKAVAATCTASGKTEGKHCSVCNTVLVAQQIVPAKGHTEVTDQAVTATCTATGLTEGKHCSVCNTVITAQQVVPAKGHTEVTDKAVAATCTAAGKTEGKHCSVCNAVIVAQQAVPATGHSWKAATCSEPKTCATCGATSGYALGHDWAGGSCTTPKTCKVCGLKDGGVVHAYAHQYDYKCDACGQERTVDMTRPMVDMFRMYDPNSGEHFYTGSTEERDNLVAVGWQYEGVGFTFPLTTGDPVHRLYDPATGEHLYTMDVEEMNMLLAQGWNYEGIAFNSGFENEVPQYRLHNPNATRGAYHFTASLEERDMLISLGWEYQGIGWYSLGA